MTPTLAPSEAAPCVTSSPSLIDLVIRDRLVNHCSPRESRTNFVARRALQGVGMCAASLGRVPFISMNLLLAKGDPLLGGLLAFCNSFSDAALITWSMFGMINEGMAPKTPEEQKLLEAHLSKKTSRSLRVLAIVTAVISQGPFAYLAYVYNNNNPLMPVIIFAVDSWVPARSLTLSFTDILERKSCTIFEKQLQQMRANTLGLVQRNQFEFISNPDCRERYLDALRELQESEEAVEYSKEYMGKVLKYNFQPHPPEHMVSKVSRIAAGILGGIFTASDLGMLGYLSYKGMDLLLSNPIVCGIAASVTVLANAYLYGTSITQTAISLSDSIVSFFARAYQPSLSEQLAPKLTYTLEAICTLIAGFSVGPAIQMSRDFLSDSLSIFEQVTLSSAVVLLVSTALFALIKEITELYVIKWGSPEEKQLMQLYLDMNKLCQIIETSPLLELAKFFNALPEEVFAQIRDAALTTRTALAEYIEAQQSLEQRPLLLVETG